MEEIQHLNGFAAADFERRRAIRVDLPFPAVVKGTDAHGRSFADRTTLVNLSACGLYMRLERPILEGVRLFVMVRLSTESPQHPAPSVALYGVVTRTTALPGGTCGVALEFSKHRFFYAPEAATIFPGTDRA